MKLVEVFERIGLVEITDRVNSQLPSERPATEIIDALPAEHDAAGIETDIAADSPAPAVAAVAEIEENRPFEDIYAAAGIADSPFSADKLLKLLEALSNLPEDTRKQAVIAIDAAEDSWTIEDPLLDARRRIQALDNEKTRLGDQARNAEIRAAKELEEQGQYEQQAVAQIRKQIAELEELMERELKSVAENRERIHTQSKSAQDACRREQQRLETEIARLQQIEKMFTVDLVNSKPHHNHQSGTQNG
jgi:hypothetical protein